MKVDLPEEFVPVTDARPDDVVWPEMPWPPPPDVVLRGNVVELTPVVPERDAAALFSALDADAVWEHVVGRPKDPASYADDLIRKRASGRFPWLVRLRVPVRGFPAGAVVGTSSYLDVAPGDARLEIGATTYAPAVWGSAVNPDAKLQLLSYAFDELSVGRVQIKTDVRNVRSQRAIARLGARYEGTLRRYQRRWDGTVRDTVLFSITAEEWADVRRGLEVRTRG